MPCNLPGKSLGDNKINISNLADNHSWLSAFLSNSVVDYILGK